MPTNRIPDYLEKDEKAKINITIIPEGHEEKEYLDKLISLNVWNNKAYKIKTIDCGKREMGYDNLLPLFRGAYQNKEVDEIILIVCDTEIERNGRYQQFEAMLESLRDKFNINEPLNNVVFFANPITMKVILSHFAPVSIRKTDDKYIRELVKKYAKVDKYDKSYNKRQELFNKIDENKYRKLKTNLEKTNSISSKYTVKDSTNILTLYSNLESEKTDWVDITKKILKS